MKHKTTTTHDYFLKMLAVMYYVTSSVHTWNDEIIFCILYFHSTFHHGEENFSHTPTYFFESRLLTP